MFYLIVFIIAFAHILYVYLGYPILLLLFDKFGLFTAEYPKTKYHPSMELPTVTLIVTAYNESRVILQKLKNLDKIDYPRDKLEILLISDGSTDNTSSIMGDFVARNHKHYKIFHERERSGKAALLNRYISKANGKIVVLNDVNAMIQKQSIRELVKPFVNERVGGVVAHTRYVVTRNKPSENAKYFRYEHFIRKLESRMGVTVAVLGGFFAIRKSSFRHFSDNAITEDLVNLCQIMADGKYVVYEPRAQAYGESARNIFGEYIRHVRLAAGGYQTIWFVPSVILGFNKLAFVFISHKLLRWVVPFSLLSIFANTYLLSDLFAFRIIFFVQCLLGIAIIFQHFLLRFTKVRIRYIGSLHAFLFMNLAFLVGPIKLLMGLQTTRWEKVTR